MERGGGKAARACLVYPVLVSVSVVIVTVTVTVTVTLQTAGQYNNNINNNYLPTCTISSYLLTKGGSISEHIYQSLAEQNLNTQSLLESPLLES